MVMNNPSATHPPTLTFSTVEPAAGLQRTLETTREDVIAILNDAGLKGDGGAGFPTGLKWQLCAQEPAFPKYVVCNADEGEPGTFKDRVILNRFAQHVIMGMTICAYVTGAHHGIIYLRGEYSYLLKHLEDIRERMIRVHRLGRNILGCPGFDFDVSIRLGSGAYVCGEESALLESLEGHRGVPRNRPPYPVTQGYRGKPTVVGNVETFAWANCILGRGAGWFRDRGTARSHGFKLLSVSGDCTRPGIYEVPWGITIAELLHQAGAENTKAVQVGGASGVCVPQRDFDRHLSFEDAATGGSIIIFNHTRNLLDVSENFLEFFCEESCGQCTPCRIGNVRLLEGVRALQAGTCSPERLDELVALGRTMQGVSKCGLGQTSANAFISIVENFRDEVLAPPSHPMSTVNPEDLP